MISFRLDVLSFVSLWLETWLQYNPVYGFFNKLVAEVEPKNDVLAPDDKVSIGVGGGLEVAIFKQSLETERFFTGNE